jgi:fructoselysine 6-kinase
MQHRASARPILGEGRFGTHAGGDLLHIACAGDTCIDENVTFGLWAPGGNALNVAVNLRRRGRPTTLYCRLGRDLDGRHIVDFLDARDIGTETIWYTDDATCHALLETDPAGRTQVARVLGKGTPVTVPGPIRPRLLAHHAVVMKGITGIEDLLTELRGSGSLSCYDYGTAPEQLRTTAADICIFSAGEGNLLLARAFIDAATQCGAQVAVATLGAEGSVGRRGDERHSIKARATEVVDTIGAGDAYFSALIDALLSGRSLPAAMSEADTAGTAACRHRFAFPDVARTVSVASTVSPGDPVSLERTRR